MKKNSLDKIAFRIIELLVDKGAINFHVDYHGMGLVFFPTDNYLDISAQEIESEINTLLTDFINQIKENR